MSYDAERELQKLIYQTLIADADVSALIGDRVYDQIPGDGQYPCIEFGPSDLVPEEVDGVTCDEISMQLDVWSQDAGRLNPCKAIVGAVKKALHYQPLTLPLPYGLVQIWVSLAQVMKDPDGVTAHGIVHVSAQVETH